MKSAIFISYSDVDKGKVQLIANELKHDKNFYPLIIAADREPLKPLVKKVSDGIIKAEFFVPILTSNSITAQWINQEIGFATAINRHIIPIVEIGIIQTLKGFIHKEIDLPYSFSKSSNKSKENKDFIKRFRVLVADLRKLSSNENKQITTDKTAFEKSLEQAEIMNKTIENRQKKAAFINSIDSVNASKAEVLKMFEDIEYKIKLFESKKVFFEFEKRISNPVMIVRSNNFSISIAWQLKYPSSTNDGVLYLRYWRGNLTLKPTNPNQRPPLLEERKYTFSLDNDNKNCWVNLKDSKDYYSEKLVDGSFAWIIDQISKSSLK
jgi:hypothetical protein